MMNRVKETIHQLDLYIKEAIQEEFFDECLLPDAVFLKGMAHLKDHDRSAAQACCRHALALEHKRCPFFAPVDCSAKRSLMRVCAVEFGNESDRAAALSEFQAAYAKGLRKCVSTETPEPVCLADLQNTGFQTWKERLVDDGSGSVMRVSVLEYSRHPQALRQALLEGEQLRSCRLGLAERGLQPELPGGAKVFVSPDLFEAVAEAVRDKDLKPWHVIVSDEFLALVEETVAALRSRDQVREKSRKSLEVPAVCHTCDASVQHDSQYGLVNIDADIPFLISRTFIHIKVPSSLRSVPNSKQTASTTDADARKGPNPRKA